MYNESYEEYIRNILGYPNYSNNSYNNSNDFYESSSRNTLNDEIEECYPEIYKIIYPRIKNACRNNSEPMSPDLIERMTDDLYSSIEADNIINISNVNINLTNEISKNENRNINIPSKTGSIQENKNNSDSRENRSFENKKQDRGTQNRGEDRQFRNRNLRDLIKILLIRELLGEIGNPGRPPIPPPRPPMRPPFPGGSGRPPFGPVPRANDRYFDIYEY